MYLKRLESIGFKSFAERINVKFVPGVTAVVGPNGSGKSNITDAIRWVLGEQSVKSLRGSKMEDIIFQGSSTRNPLNVAEVTLVLDNANQTLPLDYEEVSVTRRVYRSGVSEFYINKQPCRLKDIVDLFMGSGLGREAFSIISQGKVEDVLSSKAEERRTIFEEAAGVLKYKQRKTKAEYKLAETAENLNRVEDIIYEIEQQIDPLKKQAKTAKEYLKQSSLLKEQEITLTITEIEKLHKQWKGLLEELEDGKMKDVSLKTAIQKKEAKLANDRQVIQRLDDDIEQLQANLLEVTQQLEQTEGKKQVMQERTKHFSENRDQLEREKKEAAKQRDELKDVLSIDKAALAELETSREHINRTIEKLQTKLSTNKETITNEIERLKSIYIEHLNDQAAKRNEKQTIKNQLQQGNIKIKKQSAHFEELVKVRDQLVASKINIKKEYNLHKKTVANRVRIINELKDKLNKYEINLNDLERNLNLQYQSIAKWTSRKDMLEEMKEDFQGFFHGVKTVLKARDKNILTNIFGAVIELIDVPEAYVTAIETALGGQAQHVIVKNDQAAREAIAWLKKTNNGRATFLPLHSIQARSIPAHIVGQIKKQQGFVGVAANLVSVEGKYQKAIEHLVGNVIVTKTLADANKIAQMTSRRNRIVTLEGDVVHPGGSMSGGTRRQVNQSLFTRDKDLEAMKIKLKAAKKEKSHLEQRVTKGKEVIAQLLKEIENERSMLEKDQEKLQTIQSSYKQKEMQLESTEQNLTIFDQDKQQVSEDHAELHKKDQMLTEQLKTVENELSITQEKINTLTEEETQFQQTREQVQQKLHEQQILFAEVEERFRSQQNKTESVQIQLSETQKQYETYTTELEQLLYLQKTKNKIEKIEDKIIETHNKKEQTISAIQLKRADRTRRTKGIEDEERELKEENKQYELFMKEVQEKEVRANRLDVDLENRLSHLQTEYTITYEKASQTYGKTSDIAKTRQEVKQLKLKIKQMGPVNLGAIDEYKRISERYTFLTEQQDDLVEAKGTLFAVIAEMDKEMKTLFGTTFNRIKSEFTTVFKELFGGGNAELKLTDPDNLLETGIDIIAQPPGKNLQQLDLLSGGERALTAIALLFSILRVRPVPFCVLDEVESSLDEANVVLFAKYVKLHSKNTQFIVITHRQGTMEEADVLYGVTMQESGVSRLVSVRMEDTMELV